MNEAVQRVQGVTYLDHDDVEGDADGLVLEAPLAELVVRHTSHNFADGMFGRRRFSCNVINELNRAQARQITAPFGIRFAVRDLGKCIEGEEHDDHVPVLAEDIAKGAD